MNNFTLMEIYTDEISRQYFNIILRVVRKF